MQRFQGRYLSSWTGTSRSNPILQNLHESERSPYYGSSLSKPHLEGIRFKPRQVLISLLILILESIDRVKQSLKVVGIALRGRTSQNILVNCYLPRRACKDTISIQPRSTREKRLATRPRGCRRLPFRISSLLYPPLSKSNLSTSMVLRVAIWFS